MKLQVAGAPANVIDVGCNHDATTAVVQLGYDVLDGLLFGNGVELDPSDLNHGKLTSPSGLNRLSTGRPTRRLPVRKPS